MKLAIENFAKLDAKDKVLLLGGMAELGEESVEEHKAIVQLIDQFAWKDVALVGGDFLKIDHRYHSFQNSLSAKAWLDEMGFKNSYLLIKGSRSMQMEKLLEN